MLFVVILHSIGHGEILTNLSENTIQYNFVWGLEIFAYCAIDVFAIISGYVYYTEKKKEVKII